jgi:hypothetical protein
MRTRIIKKNNKELLARCGHGFRGRVLAVQLGTTFTVLNNYKKRRRDVAILRYNETELTDDEIYKLQSLYLKKYGTELVTLISYDYFCGSQQDGKLFQRELLPINRQTKIDFA